MRRVAVQLVAPCVVLAWLVPASGRHLPLAQQSFPTSLTATVSHLPAGERASRDPGSRSRVSRVATTSVGLLRCRQVALHWVALTGARRYTVYVSVTGREPWKPLAPKNACGESRVAGPTSVVDVEPTTGGATVVRRLYYKVAAFDGTDSTAHLLATTTIVPVELP